MEDTQIKNMLLQGYDVLIASSADEEYRPLTKVYTENYNKKSFNHNYFFDYSICQVYNIQQLHELIEMLAKQPICAILRCGTVSGKDETKQVRRIYDLEETKDNKKVEATLKGVPRYWFMVDIDNFELPEHIQALSIPEQIEYTVKHALPVEFHNASYVYQLSSGYGIKHKLMKVHLWFWNTLPLTDDELKRYFNANGIRDNNNDLLVDTAIYRIHQIHYTANPVFENVKDPVDESLRVGFVKHDIDKLRLVIPTKPKHTNNVVTLAELQHINSILPKDDKDKKVVESLLSYKEKELAYFSSAAYLQKLQIHSGSRLHHTELLPLVAACINVGMSNAITISIANMCKNVESNFNVQQALNSLRKNGGKQCGATTLKRLAGIS